MDADFDEEGAIINYGAVKIQSIVRMILVRSRLLKQLNERYEKIFDPKRERYYYYDRKTDTSSWGKPTLLLKSDISVISPTYVEGEEAKKIAGGSVGTQSVSTVDSGKLTRETASDEEESKSGSENDETGEGEEKESDPSESEYDSDDSEAVRERRRQRRKYPRSKAQKRVDAGEDDLHNTTALDLSGLGASRVTSRIYDMVEMRSLDLSDNKLTRISTNIQYFQNLERLDVHSNRLLTLPKELEELLELKFLDVSRNEITTYPGRVYKLSKLEHLNLSHNPLPVIPTEVGNLELLAELGQWEIGINFLSRLHYLNVSHCQLTVWPSQVGQLLELEHLDLSYNSLQEVPAEVADLQSLHVLLLEGNRIGKLAPDIYNLQKLEVLNLSHNELTVLPEPPPSNLATDPADRVMESLVDLNLSHNALTLLDDLLGIFANVSTFNASHNQIICFNGETISKLTALTVLEMSHNQLECFPLGLRYCTRLTHLKATNNKLGFVPETLVHTTKLITIDLSFNEITDAAGKVFAMLSHLKVLLLHHNQIGPLPAMLYTVRNLEHLDLSYNEIPIIADALGQLKSVTYLNLSHNRITSLPESVSELTQLQTLELASNRLTSLPHGLGKLYRKLNRISVERNDLTESPDLLHVLPRLMSSNLSWNPRLRGHCVDWTQFSTEYKPKKAFIPLQVLQRRVNQAVERLDGLILAQQPPPAPESHFRSQDEAKAARLAAEDAELNDFQNNIADDDPVVASAGAASVKAARKARVKNVKRLQQALEWHAALRAHVAAFAFRLSSTDLPEGRQRAHSGAVALLSDPSLSTAAKLSAARLPSVEDLRSSQSSRLNGHLYSLFKVTDKQRGGTVIGMSWQVALVAAEDALLEDRKCAELMASLPIGGEFQDSIESLQYLINECDVLLMVTELRHMMDCHAQRVHRLRLELKEDEAVQNLASGIKARLGVLSEVARKTVHDRHASDAPTNIDIAKASSSLGSAEVPVLETVLENAPESPAGSPSGRDSPDTRSSPVLGLLSGLAGLSRKRSESADGVSQRDGQSPSPGPATEATPEKEGRDESVGFEESSQAQEGGTSLKSGKSRKEMSRKEVAVDNVDVLARNIKVAAKVKRVENTLAEEAAKLNKVIVDTMAKLQKPDLALDLGALPYLAFSSVAVEGTFPGIPPVPAASQEPLLAQLVELCLHLMKALLLRCDALRDAIRILELRGGVRISVLDIAQRRGADFVDLMEDVYDELSKAVDAKENETGGKSKSIFGRKGTSSSAVFAAAMAEPTSADDSDAEGGDAAGDPGGDGDEGAAEESTGKPASLTRTNTTASAVSSGTAAASRPGTVAPPVVLLSSILPPIDKTREIREPVEAAVARRCIRHLVSHRVLTYMWVQYIAEVAAGVLKRRGVDPLYPQFQSHTKNEYNHVPEWATRCAARLAQFRGAICQGLCLYAKAIEEYTACTKFSSTAKSLVFYLCIIKLHLAQGSFLQARNSLFDCLRLHFKQKLLDFDLSDETAMPEPLDLLPINKELAMLQALIDANMKHLNAAGVFTAPYHKFLGVQSNGLLSGSHRVPVEVERGLTPYKVAAIKARLTGNARALSAANEKAEMEQSREELKNRIADARRKASTALAVEIS